MEVEITKDNAQTVRVDHPESSYGIFCFNSHGDLFLSCDYGYYCYSWRAFGDDFIKFLSKTNVDYIVNKFYVNWNNEMPKDAKSRWKFREKHIANLVTSFINELINNNQ